MRLVSLTYHALVVSFPARSNGFGGDALVVAFLQPFLHDDARNGLKAEAFVKLDHLCVRFAHQQHDLHNAFVLQPLLRSLDHRSADALGAVLRIGGNVVDPAAMPAMADHDAADNGLFVLEPDHNGRAFLCAGEAEVLRRIVTARHEIAGSPQRRDARFVLRGCAANGWTRRCGLVLFRFCHSRPRTKGAFRSRVVSRVEFRFVTRSSVALGPPPHPALSGPRDSSAKGGCWGGRGARRSPSRGKSWCGPHREAGRAARRASVRRCRHGHGRDDGFGICFRTYGTRGVTD